MRRALLGWVKAGQVALVARCPGKLAAEAPIVGMAAWSQPDAGMEQGGTGLGPGCSLAFLAWKNFVRALKTPLALGTS